MHLSVLGGNRQCLVILGLFPACEVPLHVLGQPQGCLHRAGIDLASATPPSGTLGTCIPPLVEVASHCAQVKLDLSTPLRQALRELAPTDNSSSRVTLVSPNAAQDEPSSLALGLCAHGGRRCPGTTSQASAESRGRNANVRSALHQLNQSVWAGLEICV